MITALSRGIVSLLLVLGIVVSLSHPNRTVAQTAPIPSASGLNICTAPLQAVTLDNPQTITDCTQSALQAALDQGGQITFACGPDPVTIPLSSPLTISGEDIVLDGQGQVTLDGQNQTRILENPFVEGGNNLTIQNLRFINGKAPAGDGVGTNSGGAIISGSPGTRLHIINSIFENNSTTSTTVPDNQGGAIFSNNSFETVIVSSVFRNNSAGNGGAFGGIATGLLIYNSIFANNEAVDETAGGIVRGYGGAIHLDGVTNNFNPDSNKVFTVCGSLFENNTSVRGGGAIGSVVSDGKGTKATFARSTFTNNLTRGRDGEQGQGGAIYHIEDDDVGALGEDNFEITSSTFSENGALRQGGAVWLLIRGRGTIVNTTFDRNTTTAPFNTVGQGGALSINLGLIDIVNTTFANNHAAYQGGALHGGGGNDPERVITLRNTIFANNTLNEQDQPSTTEFQGYHTNRAMNDGGNNIQFPRLKPTWDNDINNNITENPLYVDPQLGALSNNGGPTLTLPVGADSPAVDAANGENCPTADQRGVPRPQGGGCDIGAFEYQAESLVNRVYLPFVRG